MRKTRAKINREYTKNNLTTTLMFVLILPLLSIFLGFIATKYYIIPQLYSDRTTTNQSVQISNQVNPTNTQQVETPSTEIEPATEAYANTFDLDGFDMFCIQVGKFSTIENAQKLSDELSDKGMGAYIWENDGYKVITLSLLDRKGIEASIGVIREQYPDAYIITTNIPTRSISYNKDDSKYSQILTEQNKNLIKVFQDLSNLVIEVSNSTDADVNSIKEAISKLGNIRSNLNQVSPSAELSHIHTKFLEIVNTLYDELTDPSLETKKENITKLQNILSSTLTDYLKFTL